MYSLDDLVTAMREAALRHEQEGERQEQPKWSKIPDCACYRTIPVTRITTIDLAVHALLSPIDDLFNGLSVCSEGAYTFVGALLLLAASRAFAASRDPTRNGETLLEGEEQVAVLRLIDDACLNAKDRFSELHQHLARKHGN